MKYLKQVYSRYLIWKAPYVVLSFPKCGRTWLRYFLARYFHYAFGRSDALDFIPKFQTGRGDPLILFTHTGFDDNKKGIFTLFKKIKNKRIFFLVRDPRDVVVSYYHQVHKRQPRLLDVAQNEVDSMSQFIRDPVLGIRGIIRFYNTWYQLLRENVDMKIIRYEDFISDPEKRFSLLLHDLLLPGIDSGAFGKALKDAEFSSMSKKESKGTLMGARFSKGSVLPSEKKVRRGRVGGYVHDLSEQDIAYLNSELNSLDPAFGYVVEK